MMRIINRILMTGGSLAVSDNLFMTKGSIIKCNDCNEDIYEVTRDCYSGEIITASMFSGVGEVESPKDGDRLVCPICGGILDVR